MHFRVSIEGGPKEEVKIEGSHFSLGRSLKNDIPIAHESISRQHLKIRIDRGKFYVTDLDTANGTFMGEEKLIPNEEKEWPIFLPLRLGLLASIEVMEEAPPPKEEYHEFTQISERVNLKLSSNNKTKTQHDLPSTKRAPKKTEVKKATPFFNFKSVIAIVILAWLGNDYYVKKKTKGLNTGATASKTQTNVISEVLRKEISDLDAIGPCAGEQLSISCEKTKINKERGEGLFVKNDKLYVVLNLRERLLNGEVQHPYSFAFGKEKDVYLMSYFVFKHREEFEDKNFSSIHVINGKNIFYLENLITVARQDVYSFSERDLIQIFTDLTNGNPTLFKQLILPIVNVFNST